MIFELINPSDPVAFEAPDLELAALATLYVGRGQYAAVAEHDNELRVPLFMFGGEKETDKWFQKHFGRILQESIETRKSELPAVLRSFMIGKPRDLAAYQTALSFIPTEKHEEFKARYKNDRQSSMNDIAGYAWQCADQLEGKNAAGVPAPRSVYTA